MGIEAGKFYRTRGGYKVKIYNVNVEGKRPIVGTIDPEIIDQALYSWREGGIFGFGLTELDIIEEWGEPLNGINKSEVVSIKKYRIKDLTDKQVIHAPTLEMAEKLGKKFDELGLKWGYGASYLEDNCWERYGEETCYGHRTRTCYSKKWYQKNGYEILTVDQLLNNHPDKKYTAQDSFGEWRVFYEKPKRNLFFWEGNKEQGEVLSKPLVKFKGSWENSLHELVEDRFVKTS